MRQKFLVGALVLAATAVSHPAVANRAPPWCAVISLAPTDVYWDCQYRTFEECLPNVLAGNRGFCSQNPAYSGPELKPKRKIHHRRRSHR